MGLFGSTPSPPPSPPPSLEFEKPWRTMPWGRKATLEDNLRSFSLSTTHVRFVRILLVGEVGAGKSSFINSINNAFQKRITSGALAGVASTSFTKVYKTHYIKGKDGLNLPFVFNDIMGLEREDSHGVHIQDLLKAINGLLKEGYKFNPVMPVSGNDCKSNPSTGDQAFCVVNILPADKVSLMDEKIVQKLKMIREEASNHNLPQVVIMTKVDEVCPLVKENLRKVYTSKKIKEKMQNCSHLLGIPVNHIFPVKNYHEEVDTHDDMDVLILKALEQIVNLANDALESQNCDETG
ncbi:interferon-induced protein 44-like [Neoarius graeffei]|uniref:interferon-induced protein 44-like n=1 Tax=Neoarius graeffei TaxID=443677 RepID=UPI00298C51CA|nr:interferon-induced protein 44-like [Neoarius graeffei]